MTNKASEKPQREEGTVDTAFSVWANDKDSELDHGVGELDPAMRMIDPQRTIEGPRKTHVNHYRESKTHFQAKIWR